MCIRYVVRGAILHCTMGTDIGFLDLPQSHGSYVNGFPLMIDTDSVPFDNIPSFGGCKGSCGKNQMLYSPNNHVPSFSISGNNQAQSSIAAVSEPSDFKDLNGNIFSCYLCTPFTAERWSEAYASTRIWKESTMGLTGEKALIFPNSFLTCLHGGTIKLVTHGQLAP